MRENTRRRMMRLKAVLLTASMMGTCLSSLSQTEGAYLTEIVTTSARAARVMGIAKPTVRYVSYSATYKPWQHLPMEAVVRDVRFDETFKILLGEEGAENRAISFLNALFQPQTNDERIKAIRYLDRTLNSTLDRTLHFDVKIEGVCETYAGQRFIVEMQKARIPSHSNRWVYYGARELAAMGERNYKKALEQTTEDLRKKAHKEHYHRLDPVRVVTILDFDSPKTKEELKNSHDVVVNWEIRERQSLEIASPLLSWTYVMLPRFLNTLPVGQKLDFRGKPLDAWLYLMTREDKEKILVTNELVSDEEALAEGFHRISHLTDDEAESLQAGQFAFASRIERELEKFTEGKVQGKAEGEKAKALEIARNLKSMNLTRDKIKAATSLTESEIDELK